jgi:glycosyltransferase involved in cell wall biosynthesis
MAEPAHDITNTGDHPEELTILDPVLQARVASKAETPKPIPEPPAPPRPVEPVRERIRVLLAAARYAAYGQHFEEVHIIVPNEGERPFDGIQLAPNVWAYPTNSRAWWMYPIDVYRIASKQLRFAGEFRADVVTTSDPFELGIFGWLIARRFKRPLVIEASEQLYDRAFVDENDDNGYRAWFARFVLPRAVRIRARSERLRDIVARSLPGSASIIDVVPRHIDSTAFESSAASKLLAEKYPQFTFVLLVVAALSRGSGVDIALNAAANALRQYPKLGMIVLGDGPEAERFAALATEKGLVGKVYFESMPDDLAPYLRSAHMLIMPKAALLSEEVLMSAAAAGLPVLISKDAMVGDIFVDQTSAMVCAQNDVGCAIQAITRLMNDSVLRERLSSEARLRAHAAVQALSQGGESLMQKSLEDAVLSWYDQEDAEAARKTEA